MDRLIRHNQLALRAQWLLERAQGRRSVRKLRAALRVLDQVIGEMRPDHPDRAGCLMNLSAALCLRYQWTSELSALDRLIALQESFRGSLGEDAVRAAHRANLQSLVPALLIETRRSELLDLVVPLVREAAAGPVSQPLYREALLICLSAQFERTDDEAVLRELVALRRDTSSSLPDGDPDLGEALGSLGGWLRALALRTGEYSWLTEAITVGRQATARCPAGHPYRAMALSGLGNSLHARFVYADRDPATLREAVTLGRQAVEAAPKGHQDRASCLSSLGLALRTLFEETRQMDVLHEAVRVSEEAVGLDVPERARMARYLGHLSSIYQELHKRTGERGVVERAMAASRRAVDLSHPGTRQRSELLSDYGNALHILAVAPSDELPDGEPVTRAPQGTRDDAAVLRHAVAVSREAVSTGSGHRSGQAGRLANLSIAARTLFELTGDRAALEEALQAGRAGEAAEDKGTTGHDAALLALARARALSPTEPGALPEMRRCCAALDSAPPRTRVSAHMLLGRVAMVNGRSAAETALAAYEEAIAWLPAVAPRGLLRPEREYGIAEFAGLPAEAASAALGAGRPERAVRLLEHARGLLLRERLENRRELAELRRSAPDLAGELVRLRELLNASDQTSVDLYRDHRGGFRGDVGIGVAGEAVDGHRERARRHQGLAEQWEALLARIRALPGLEGFLRPPPLSALRNQSEVGPVVLVNPSRFRCDALILTAGGRVRIVPLDCTWDEVRERARAFQRSPRDVRPPGVGPSTAKEADTLRHLAWLWEKVCRPVLAEAGLLSQRERPVDPARRVWWCPVGMAAFLPLHAAGQHETLSAGESVMDHVISSYTSTVYALRLIDDAHSVNAGAPQDHGRVLVVEAGAVPGARPLPGARLEAERIAELAPGVTSLSGSGATRDAVLAALPGHDIVHFACHAVTEPRSPWLSRLVLRDHASAPLTANDLHVAHVPRGRLAYLSACDTARTTERLADEAVHIASALQLAGFRHVIGTLWPVRDSAAGRIADDFHTGMAPSWEADGAAAALHRAVRALRDDAPDEPSRWAAHIHLGP